MTRSARYQGKGVALDPASAAALAANVVSILRALGGPIAAVLKRRLLRRRLLKVVKGVSLNFVAGHPEAAGALAASAEAIAHELARLMGAGRPLAPKDLADQWAATGRLGPADAHRLAAEYARALHDGLLQVDEFGTLFKTGAVVTTAEAVQGLENATRDREEREVAAAYYDAADKYVHAALALRRGDQIGAMGSEYDAQSLLDRAELNLDWHIIERFTDVRQSFRELVEQQYDEFEAAFDTGDSAATGIAFEALKLGCGDFKALVKERRL